VIGSPTSLLTIRPGVFQISVRFQTSALHRQSARRPDNVTAKQQRLTEAANAIIPIIRIAVVKRRVIS
jgi:hypothetical protein